MADIEEKSVQSMTLSEDEKKAKHKSNTMEAENVQPSLQMAANTILDIELGNPAEIQETESKVLSLINTSNLPILSKKIDNQSSVVLETDISVNLSMQEFKNQNPSHTSGEEKTSTIVPEDQVSSLQMDKNDSTESESLQPSSLQITESAMSPILDLELRNPSNVQVPENRIPSPTNISNFPMLSKLLDNQSSAVAEMDTVVHLSTQEVKNQNEFHIPTAEKTTKILCEDKELLLQKHNNDNTESDSLKPSSLEMAESAMSPILDLEIGDPSESQQAEYKMSSLDITRPTLSKIRSNQSSVKLESVIVNKLPVQEISCQISSQMSSVLQNIETVDGKKFSNISFLQNNLQPILDSGVQFINPIFGKYSIYLETKLKEARMLPTAELEHYEAESNGAKYLLLLEIMGYITMWLDEIKHQNEFYTQRYLYLNKVIKGFSELEETLEEKLNLLRIGRSFSGLEHDKQSEYEAYVYDSFYTRGGNTLDILKKFKKNMDEAFLQFSNSRIFYINSSYQISLYPFEEKLFEKGKTLIEITNKLSEELNKQTEILVGRCAFIHFFGMYCSKIVSKYFNDIEMTLGV